MLIVDAHEDIAYNMVAYGRDYTRPAKETRQREVDKPQAVASMGNCMLGLPEWISGHVAVIFATLFAMPAYKRAAGSEPHPQEYTTPQEAYAQGMRQMDVYERLADENPHFRLIRTQADLTDVLATWKEETPEAEEKRQIGFVTLMEGADPIVKPQDVEPWYERGLRAVGPSWQAGTRYAGGNMAPGPLTDEGVRLLHEMANFNMILDISHLSDQSCLQALNRYDGPCIASHSNPRALVQGERQLSNDMLRALVQRDGVAGICTVNSMLRRGWRRGDRKDAVTVVDVAAAMDYVCQVAGDAVHVGLGTDFDGGFGAESAPAELDTIADLPTVAGALKARGYAQADIEAIMGGNWLRVLRRALP